MKILYLITKSEIGGAQMHVSQLTDYFSSNNHDVVVMSKGGGWLANECVRFGARFVASNNFGNGVNPLKIVKAITEIRCLIAELKPDIVHCHSSAAAFLGRLAVRGKIPTIYTAHGWGFNTGVPFWIKYPVLAIEYYCSKYTDVIICVSEFVKNLGLRYCVAKPSKFVVVYNGVRIPVVKTSQRTAANRFIFTGRLAEPKIVELAFEAMCQMPDEVVRQIEFTIVGDGPKKNQLLSIANTLGIKTLFKGCLPHDLVVQELQNSDIFIFLSRWEGFPYAILEAMANGLPIIASNVGGIGELVNNDCGTLVDNTVSDVATAIQKYLGNQTLCDRCGKVGRMIVEEKYTIEQMCANVAKIYSSLL